MEPTYKIYAKGFRVGPLPLSELKVHLVDTPAPAGATVTLASPIGDQFGPIEHFPELVPYIASPFPIPATSSVEFIGPKAYVHNHIPLGERLAALAMIAVGSAMLWVYWENGETIVWASKRGPDIKAVGCWGLPTASFMLGGIIASAAMIADHYDKRPNEHIYRRVMGTALALMLIGKISMIIIFHHLSPR